MTRIVLAVILPATAGLVCVSGSLFLVPYVPARLSPEVLVALAVAGVSLLVFATAMQLLIRRRPGG